MAYTRTDAEREVGDSKDWLVGLEASIKKWEQRVGGDVDSYSKSARCGVCFVADNRDINCARAATCLASSICKGGQFTIDTSEGILQALKKLRKELDPMNCKDKCANYKSIEVERPTDHPNRIFAEDLRVGMVIRRHGTAHQRKLVVILDEPAKTFVSTPQLLTGFKPTNTTLILALSGLKPYEAAGWRGGKHCPAGSWDKTAWCEEVT